MPWLLAVRLPAGDLHVAETQAWLELAQDIITHLVDDALRSWVEKEQVKGEELGALTTARSVVAHQPTPEPRAVGDEDGEGEDDEMCGSELASGTLRGMLELGMLPKLRAVSLKGMLREVVASAQLSVGWLALMRRRQRLVRACEVRAGGAEEKLMRLVGQETNAALWDLLGEVLDGMDGEGVAQVRLKAGGVVVVVARLCAAMCVVGVAEGGGGGEDEEDKGEAPVVGRESLAQLRKHAALIDVRAGCPALPAMRRAVDALRKDLAVLYMPPPPREPMPMQPKPPAKPKSTGTARFRRARQRPQGE